MPAGVASMAAAHSLLRYMPADTRSPPPPTARACIAADAPGSQPTWRTPMRKMILMAIAGYLWKKYKAHNAAGSGPAARATPRPTARP